MARQGTHRKSQILLDGYIELHKQCCAKEECPLKQNEFKTGTHFINGSRQSIITDDQSVSKYVPMIHLLNKMYFYGIRKFPNNTGLRINYSFFLLENLRMKQQALQELNLAERSKPSFDEEFVIFRYRKIIEDEIAENKNQGTGNLDIVSEIHFQNRLRNCLVNIEKSSMYHMEFWGQLCEDTPDLNKLNKIGIKIIYSVRDVEDQLFKLQRISNNMPRALKLYGKFLTEVTNDKDAGEEYLGQARTLINMNYSKKNGVMNYSGSEDLSRNSTASILVSGEPDKLGIITAVNVGCAKIFGYTKSELINRNIKILMPQIYAKHHDIFFEEYLTTNELKCPNKERPIFGKYKNNYIFPLYISLQPIQNTYQMLNLFANFRLEKYLSPICHMIILESGNIDSVSSNAPSVLKIDNKALSKNPNVQYYFPFILEDISGYTTRTGKTFLFYYPVNAEYLDPTDPVSCTLNCVMRPFWVGSDADGKEKVKGYHLKLSKVDDDPSVGSMRRRHIPCNFQFRYDLNKNVIVGEFTDNMVDDLLSDGDFDTVRGSHFRGSEMTISNYQKQMPEKNDIDYGLGIKILRLVDGKAMEILDESDEENPENPDAEHEHGHAQTLFGNNPCKGDDEEEIDEADDFSTKMFNTMFKTRKTLTSVLSTEKTPGTVTKLSVLGTLMIVLLLCMVIVQYFGFFIHKFETINTNILMLNSSYVRIAEAENILSKIQHLEL
jgi:PAS domain S-box-containing protein